MKMSDRQAAAWQADLKALQRRWIAIAKSSEKAEKDRLKKRAAELRALAKKHGVKTTSHSQKAIAIGIGIGAGFHPCPDPDIDSVPGYFCYYVPTKTGECKYVCVKI